MLSLRPEDATALPMVKLADYQPPDWLVDSVHLTFLLHPTATRIVSRLRLRRNADGATRPDLRLLGRKLTLVSASIDGVPLKDGDYALDEEGLTVSSALLDGDAVVWECETEVDPKANTALEGLYMSRDMFCTQCEAEGFR
ncbi:MAG: aminopeptidase N, partial [Pseudomonadota bacterium]